MAHNTKPILTDVNGKPIPQYFDPLADEYKSLLGQHGAARSVLYGPDGQPIGTAGNPLQVKAHDTDTVLGQIKDALGPLATETKLEAVRVLLAALEGKDFATQTTLAQVKQVLDALSGAVSTSSKQDALNIAVEDLKSELILVKSELANIKANQLSGDQKVQLSGAIDYLLHGLTSDRMIGSPAQFWGETVGPVGLVNSIDISGVSEVAVVLKNNHDVAVKVTRMCLTRQARQVPGAAYANAVYLEEKTTSIPAGASVYLDKEIYATLGKIGAGLVLLIERDTAPTSGDLTMLVYGRRN